MLKEELWDTIGDVYQAIITHPFIKGLTDGSLPLENFKYYIVQDAIYLSKFSRALAVTGAKATDDDLAVSMFSYARDALLVERKSLHEFLASEWGMKAEHVYSQPMNPVNMAYTNYLIATAYSSPFHESLAALLPCFWVYWEVGKELLGKGSPNKTYRRWIDTYSSEDYAKAVQRAIDLAEQVFKRLAEDEIKEIKRHFRMSTVYEYMFWDSAYKMERFPFKV